MLLLELTTTDYLKALDLQQRIVERKIRQPGPDVLILLEHPPTVTLGVRGKSCHLHMSSGELQREGVAVHRVDRGGEATYHGPGQLVGYPIVDLRALRLSAREYVRGVEEVIIRTLASFGLVGLRRPSRPGVWTGPEDKIASIGVRIQRRITSHGFSLNVAVPVDPNKYIISCGLPGIRLVSVNDLVERAVSLESVRRAVAESFSAHFGVSLVPCSLEEALDPEQADCKTCRPAAAGTPDPFHDPSP